MVYLDVHIRTPEFSDGQAKSVYFPPSDTLSADIRSAVFDNYPEATDYSFKEVSPREVSRRDRETKLHDLVRSAINYASIQSQLDKKKGF
ncbi:MAG: hypothetical protein ABIR46_00160 [Candidatus Saccharimonadales bacterium]